MRRDDKARELLVRIVGERENDPGGLRPRLQRAHLDAPHDAVGAGRGGNLNAVALRAVMLDGRGQIDRVGVDGHANRLNRPSGLAAENHPQEESRQARCASQMREELRGVA